VVHAERNAVLNYRGSLGDFQGATMYTTHYPCNECAKEIVQVGIKSVVHLNGPRPFRMEDEAASMIFDAARVGVEKFRSSRG
jgi:dCMP deaminase